MSYRAYLAFKNHGILPHDYMALPQEEQAFLTACDLNEAQEQRDAIERARKRGRR